MRVFYLLWVLVFGLAAPIAQAESIELETCIDANGRKVPGEPDSSLEVLVRAGMQGGQRIIRYNPELLPNLSAAARQFFFAHECARLSLGTMPGAALAAGRARTADCVGVATLQDSGLLKDRAAVEALEAELVFSDEEWGLLPGPKRTFNLASCPKRAGIVLPLANPPSPEQVDWNACARQCADRSFRCQGACRGDGCLDGCQSGYDRCQAACKTR